MSLSSSSSPSLAGKLVLEMVQQKSRLAVLRLPASAAIPGWILAPTTTAITPNFTSITRTSEELSLVCPEIMVPKDAEYKMETGWTLFKICGPLDFALTGILSQLIHPLASNGISIFAISTYDTDYILVKHDKAEATAQVWRQQGHTVVETDRAFE